VIAVVVVVLLFIAVGLAGMRWGADSRAGREWQPVETPALDWCAGSPRCP
jgi:hypothetical protein